jgi:hypothetical protein
MASELRGHMIALTDSFSDPRPWAECSCGWAGPKRKTRQAAWDDGRQHLDSVQVDPSEESRR